MRRDLRSLTRALRPAVTRAAATELAAFDRPTWLAWATDDRLFPLEHAYALAALMPNAQVELIADSRAFSMLDQTEVLAGLVSDFAVRRAPSA
ncbi:alpha/beta fold hydrolase [Blastococcus montanus]|uniref:alpha/beta fold hydrolase n=1 Tax=Blastococcus montanus TaxID=3144973 RepID=UPI00320AE8B9